MQDEEKFRLGLWLARLLIGAWLAAGVAIGSTHEGPRSACLAYEFTTGTVRVARCPTYGDPSRR